MKTRKTRALAPGFLAVFLLAGQVVSALDSRSTPIEVNLIVDGSLAMKNAGEQAIDWVTGYLIDGILRDGDRITIWNAGGKAQMVYSETISGTEGKETVKKTLRSLIFQGNQADFAGALRDAAQRTASRSGISYTLLLSGSSAALSPALLGAGAPLLRYSRIEEFPAWRALVVALGIDSQVQRAVSAYFSGS